MINNIPSGENNKQDLYREVYMFCGKAIADGVSAGIMKFAKVANLDVSPGPKSKIPLLDFVLAFSNEFAQEGSTQIAIAQDYPYPFKDSFKSIILQVLTESEQIIKELWDNGERDTLASLCRTIGCGETVRFLEEHKPEAIKAIKELRG